MIEDEKNEKKKERKRKSKTRYILHDQSSTHCFKNNARKKQMINNDQMHSLIHSFTATKIIIVKRLMRIQLFTVLSSLFTLNAQIKDSSA